MSSRGLAGQVYQLVNGRHIFAGKDGRETGIFKTRLTEYLSAAIQHIASPAERLKHQRAGLLPGDQEGVEAFRQRRWQHHQHQLDLEHRSISGLQRLCATKGAVDTLTFALARELEPRRIRVNSIFPGHTNTPATDGNFAGEFGMKLVAGTPLGRFGEPEDIAPVAVFLASKDSHWVTGESLWAACGVRRARRRVLITWVMPV